jgi:membrane-associated HD superfamily phosphohydrolase
MITKLQLAKRVASLVVYGHVILFIYGLIVMLASGYDRVDTFQMILMGSPLLAMVALSAFRFMANLPDNDESGKADPAWVTMSTAVTGAFLLALFATFSMAMFNTALEISILKIIVGTIETALGSYLGINRDTLFPDKVETAHA